MERFEHGGDIYGGQGIVLDFSVNTNPLGLPDAVSRALVSRVSEFSHYPDPYCRELREAIARHENVRPDQIVCGNGAADLIYRPCYSVKPRCALVCAPTFSEYERALEQIGCKIRHYPLREENGFALTDAIMEQITPDVDLLFLCHPNNPTGRLIRADLMERILDRSRSTHSVVVMDECFLDFSDGISAKRYLDDIPVLIVLKAFTKIYAMAGLRLGYLLCSDAVLRDRIGAAAQCWSVSVPAQIAGVAALSCAGWAERARRLVAVEREFLYDSLRYLGITVFPSDANFLLMRSDLPLYELLLQKGILLRCCDNFVGLGGSYCRVGVKTHADNIFLLEAIMEISSCTRLSQRRVYSNGNNISEE